jgi:hypothetical protein
MTTTNQNDKNEKTEAEQNKQNETDGEEFQVTVKKLDLPVKPRGVLAE